MLCVVALATLPLLEIRLQEAAAAEQAKAASALPCFGAASVHAGFEKCPQDPSVPPVPSPAAAKMDRSDAYEDDCWTNKPFTERSVCRYGTGPTRVALVGNSHAGHWLPALQVIAKEHDWQITTFLVSQCNITTAPLDFGNKRTTANCLDYGKWVTEELVVGRFDMVITSERQSVPTEGDTWNETRTTAAAGYREMLLSWADSGSQIVVLRDTPDPGRTLQSVPDCLAQSPADATLCSGSPEQWAWMDPLYDAAQNATDASVHTVDMNGYFCVDGLCPPVIGSVVVYFDASHITATYGRTLAPYLSERLLPVLGPSTPLATPPGSHA
jgi:hypothetical protein